MKLNITAISNRLIWFITLVFLVLSLTISFALGDADYGACVIRMLVWINTMLSRTRPGAHYTVIYMDAYVYATTHRRLLS